MKRESYLLLTLLITFSLTNVLGQGIDVDKASGNDVEWSEGTITLTDNTVLSGLLRLNTKNGLLGYENGSTSKSFTPRNVISFNYFDAVENKKRTFLSIDLKNLDQQSSSGKKKQQKISKEMRVPQFLEVLMEFETFALISTVGRLNVRQNTQSITYGIDRPTHTQTIYSHNETFYILDNKEALETIMTISHIEKDNMSSTKKSYSTLIKSVLEKYTTPHYEQLEALIKEQKIKFKTRDDLIRVFEFYKTLISN